MHARTRVVNAHKSRKCTRAHLRFVIEGIMQQFEPLQPGFWDSQDFNWILYDWTHIPLPNVHMNQPSSLFSNFKTIFFSSIMSVNFYKYCHIILTRKRYKFWVVSSHDRTYQLAWPQPQLARPAKPWFSAWAKATTVFVLEA